MLKKIRVKKGSKAEGINEFVKEVNEAVDKLADYPEMLELLNNDTERLIVMTAVTNAYNHKSVNPTSQQYRALVNMRSALTTIWEAIEYADDQAGDSKQD